MYKKNSAFCHFCSESKFYEIGSFYETSKVQKHKMDLSSYYLFRHENQILKVPFTFSRTCLLITFLCKVEVARSINIERNQQSSAILIIVTNWSHNKRFNKQDSEFQQDLYSVGCTKTQPITLRRNRFVDKFTLMFSTVILGTQLLNT